LRLKKTGSPKNASSKNGARRETFGLSPESLRTLRALKTPAQIQKFVDGITYQYADTAGSPERVLRERKGHCMEGALVAAAAFRVHGHRPLLMDLEAVRDDDQVVALYRERGLWGGVAKSNFAGLRFRAPVYRTLRAYSVPVNLARLDDQHWMTSEEDVWCVPELLIEARHYPIIPHKVARTLPRLDRRSFEAGMHGRVKH
jgi:hypothetical protein